MNLQPLVFSPLGPSENSDFSIDVASMLNIHETISNASVTGDPGSLTIGTASVLKSVVTVWISGGVAGTSYLVTWTIATSLLDEHGDNRTIVLEAILNCRA